MPRAGIVALIALLSVPLTLFAHAHLRRSTPSDHERLTSPPTAIRLWFTERPELGFTRVRLRGTDSSEISLGSPQRMADDPMGVTLPISTSLKKGTYTVIWRTAAADGHATNGSFSFDVAGEAVVTAATGDTTATVRTGAEPGIAPSNAPLQPENTTGTLPSLNASAATRWLEYMAMLAVIGAVVFRMVVLPRAGQALAGALPGDGQLELADSVRRLAQNALVLLVITSVARLYGEARAVLGPDRPVDAAALRTILDTGWGTGWLLGAAGIVVAAIGFIIVKRARSETGWSVAALGALAIGIAPALTGHASATAPVALALSADVLHVLAACAWLGALLALLFAALPLVRGGRSMQGLASGTLVAGLVRSFHPLALTCAAIVVATGLVSAWLRLPTVASLWSSTYGRVLLVKLLFVAIVVVLGALNWKRMLPRLGDERGARRITRTASTELAIAALVLAVTAVLASTSPPDRALTPATISVTH